MCRTARLPLIVAAVMTAGMTASHAAPAHLRPAVVTRTRVPARPARKTPASWLGVYLHGQTAMISGIVPRTPAARADLRAGDVVVSVDEKGVRTASDLVRAIAALKPGTRIVLFVRHQGSGPTVAVPVVVEARPSDSELLRRRFVGIEAPDVAFPQVGGGLVHLRDLRGEVVVLEVFSTYCRECKDSFQTLMELADRGALVMGVSSEERATLETVLTKGAVPFAVLADVSERLKRMFEVTAEPLFVVLDSDGVIRHVGIGTEAGELDRAFDAATEALRARTLRSERAPLPRGQASSP